MVLDGRWLPEQAGEVLESDRFRQVESGVVFRKAICYRCGLAGFYKYRVLQVRRHPEIRASEEEAVRGDHRRIWEAMPRFAEIPETVKCRRCQEVLGIYPECVY